MSPADALLSPADAIVSQLHEGDMSVFRIPITVVLALLLVIQPALLSAGDPEPYEPEEFPRVARDLRRFQIITLGSVPLTLLFSSLGYRAWRLATEEDLTWRDSGVYTDEQRNQVLGIGLSLSVGVGMLDFLLGVVSDD